MRNFFTENREKDERRERKNKLRDQIPWGQQQQEMQ